MIDAIARHWFEYLIEGGLLGVFMAAACGATVALEHPDSPFRAGIPSAFHRRCIIGVLMGVTAIVLIYSPMGRRSGAHMNPATTLTFLALGKIDAWDALFYVFAQCAGGLIGVLLSALLLGDRIRHPAVSFAVTAPGSRGSFAAWLAEFVISFLMMAMVLVTANNPSTAAFTGLFAGALLVLFITFEAPLSGMSINPARTLASAIPARNFRGLWIYLTAPTLAMLAAAGLYTAGGNVVRCAKLNHEGNAPCIFHCLLRTHDQNH